MQGNCESHWSVMPFRCNTHNEKTHDIKPASYFSSGMMGFPCSSSFGVILNAASTETIPIHNEDRAINRPGQVRRPKPNAASGHFVTGPTNRSGLNLSGSGNTSSSWSIALQGLNSRTRVRHRFTHQAFAITMDPAGKKRPS
jgi:hypothetical protein